MGNIQTARSIGRGETTDHNRIDGSGAVVTSGSGSSRFGEAVLKGRVFHGASITLTLAASGGNLVASAADAATNTALVNPVGSGVNIVLLRVAISVNSGTFAAGGVYHGVANGHTIATSLSGMARGTNAKVGSGELSAGYVFTKATQSARTGGAAPTQLCPIAGTTATAAANAYFQQVIDEVDGSIVLSPGSEYLPLFTGVGTTVIYNVGYTWMEIPIAAT
jgi:hypothetical protein